jgi:8-oxo-dGTP pyrophosphatase MutT (NUDIX family)
MPSWYRDPAAPEPNRPLRVGAVALIERDGAVLVERRADDGSWGLIAGAVEAYESIVEALRREIYEESALLVAPAELLGIFSEPSRIVGYADGNVYRVLAIAFVVTVCDGDPVRSEESLELRFVPRVELLSLDLTPAHRAIVETYLAGPPRPVVA